MTDRDAVVAVAAFSRALRSKGLPVAPDRTLAFCRATALLPPADLYWAGRLTLVDSLEHLATYDEVFVRFFGAPPVRPAVRHGPRPTIRQETARSIASREELLRTKHFARCTPDELEELRRLMERLRPAIPPRRTRRRRPGTRGAPDLARTLRRSFRTGGEPVVRIWRRRTTRPRRIAVLIDVSGSMAASSRGLLLYAHALANASPRCEAFCFGTRLTKLTTSPKRRSADLLLERAAAEVVDWHGGTRIGDALKVFVDDHDAAARGAVVIICSDGLDVGEPDTVAHQMDRLARLAHRIVWLNPLIAEPGYQPLARGMSAALPYVDRFLSGHNLASIHALGRELADLSTRRMH